MTAYDTSWAEFCLCPKCANISLRKGDIVAQGTRRDHCAVCREPLDKARRRVWALAGGADAARDNAPYILREIVWTETGRAAISNTTLLQESSCG